MLGRQMPKRACSLALHTEGLSFCTIYAVIGRQGSRSLNRNPEPGLAGLLLGQLRRRQEAAVEEARRAKGSTEARGGGFPLWLRCWLMEAVARELRWVRGGAGLPLGLRFCRREAVAGEGRWGTGSSEARGAGYNAPGSEGWTGLSTATRGTRKSTRQQRGSMQCTPQTTSRWRENNDPTQRRVCKAC